MISIVAYPYVQAALNLAWNDELNWKNPTEKLRFGLNLSHEGMDFYKKISNVNLRRQS